MKRRHRAEYRQHADTAIHSTSHNFNQWFHIDVGRKGEKTESSAIRILWERGQLPHTIPYDIFEKNEYIHLKTTPSNLL